MRDPSAAELLDVWEIGSAASTEAAAVALLEFAWPDPDIHALDLPIGERDRRLLELRLRLFGPRLASLMTCSSCGDVLETTFDAGDIRVADTATSPVPAAASVGGRVIPVRFPTSRDLVAIGTAPSAADARRLLAARCIARDPEHANAEEVPDDVVDAVERALAAADPGADIELEAGCPSCGSAFRSVFDIAAFLRIELDAWARRTLHEVATLAAAFGWHERDILTMSAWRRRYYVEAAS